MNAILDLLSKELPQPKYVEFSKLPTFAIFYSGDRKMIKLSERFAQLNGKNMLVETSMKCEPTDTDFLHGAERKQIKEKIRSKDVGNVVDPMSLVKERILRIVTGKPFR